MQKEPFDSEHAVFVEGNAPSILDSAAADAVGAADEWESYADESVVPDVEEEFDGIGDARERGPGIQHPAAVFASGETDGGVNGKQAVQAESLEDKIAAALEASYGGMTSAEVGAAVRISAGATQNLLDAMESAGDIRRNGVHQIGYGSSLKYTLVTKRTSESF